MKKSLAHDGIVRGLHEAAKALDKYVLNYFFIRGFLIYICGTQIFFCKADESIDYTVKEYTNNCFGFRRQALLCILAENCSEAMYKKLVQGLCNEHQIPLITVDDNKKLGEWAGLCKIDNTGKARKIVGCSCVVIRVSSDSVLLLYFL